MNLLVLIFLMFFVLAIVPGLLAWALAYLFLALPRRQSTALAVTLGGAIWLLGHMAPEVVGSVIRYNRLTEILGPTLVAIAYGWAETRRASRASLKP